MRHQKQTILAVDDNPTNLKVLELVFRNIYEVISVDNGFDAIEVCNNDAIDLVLLDIMMPEMDGYEVCERLKRDMATKHIPVIFITAKTATEDIVKGFDVGGVDYLTKPFKKAELMARVRTHIELKTLRGILPICASCKDIRNDDGFWKQIEAYIGDHSEAEFSHSMCPDCMKKMYPKLADKMAKKG